MNPPSIFDRSVKALIHHFPLAFIRLASAAPAPESIHEGDTAINLPEFRADHIFVIGDPADPERWGLHFEYQIEPDARQHQGWFFKNAVLTRQYEMPVFLVVVYLTRGNYATFPNSYSIRRSGFENEFRFTTIKLWEHRERILSGEVPELAPLLVLCENKPDEATLREERRLIKSLDVPDQVRADLLSIAITVGTRFFGRDLLESVFREEMQLMKTSSFIEDWILEGEAAGEARGESREARRIASQLLERRFGPLPPALTERIETSDAPWCEEIILRATEVGSLDQLQWQQVRSSTTDENASTN